ncbi:hypothetical protein HDV00_002089 [Rhizophlyctis rosea]|nr:hypothetical protein HDV00_002089 [Rhizophlyctis rosea]
MNGTIMNGTVRNGTVMNGTVMNGTVMNGTVMNEAVMNEAVMNEAVMNETERAGRDLHLMLFDLGGKRATDIAHPVLLDLGGCVAKQKTVTSYRLALEVDEKNVLPVGRKASRPESEEHPLGLDLEGAAAKKGREASPHHVWAWSGGKDEYLNRKPKTSVLCVSTFYLMQKQKTKHISHYKSAPLLTPPLYSRPNPKRSKFPP